MKLLATAAAALLITTAAADADAGRIPSGLQGAWCKVAGKANLYKSGHCANDIHVTANGYALAAHSHALRQCTLTASFRERTALLADFDCTGAEKVSMRMHKHRNGQLHMWASDVSAASKAARVANAQ
jgi:hypothetical protein